MSRTNSIPKYDFSSTTSPDVTDDITKGFSIGSQWVNTTTDSVYQMTDSTAGAAVWVLLGTVGTGDVVGPASATSLAVAIYNGTTGKLLKNSAILTDSSNNIKANNFVPGFSTTATAAATTTLTIASTQIQEFTGSTTQTITLPVVSTLQLGQSFIIVNRSSGALTVNSSGGNLVQTIAASSSAEVTVVLITGTTAASWDSVYTTSNASTVTTVDAGADTTTWILLGNAQTGNQAPATDAGLTYNASTDTLSTTAVTLSGALNAGSVVAPTLINAQSGTTYTFVLTDASKIVTGSNAGATTYTVPKNATVAYPVGTTINIAQLGTGKITFAPVDGTVTINSSGGLLSIGAQYVAVSLVKTATDTWLLIGSLIA